MCAKIKICLEKIRKEVFRTGSMFMSNVMSVYFSNVKMSRGGWAQVQYLLHLNTVCPAPCSFAGAKLLMVYL